MKKIICLLAVVLMIASVALAAPKMPITAKDLPGLKGTWSGVLGFGVTDQGGTSPATLEILSDTVPVKFKFTIRDIPQQIASQTGAQQGQNVVEGEFVLTSQGTLMFMGAAKNFFEVSLTSKDKINIWYIYNTMRGDGNFSKKKK
ncbi:MAG: hypothetical protein ACXWMO_06660 [Syntrophales bacterium]